TARLSEQLFPEVSCGVRHSQGDAHQPARSCACSRGGEMAQLDRLLAAMVSNRADALLLDDGEAARLEIGGALRALTKTPLTDVQITELLKEVTDADGAAQLDAKNPLTFSRSTDDGAFVIRAMVNNGH